MPAQTRKTTTAEKKTDSPATKKTMPAQKKTESPAPKKTIGKRAPVSKNADDQAKKPVKKAKTDQKPAADEKKETPAKKQPAKKAAADEKKETPAKKQPAKKAAAEEKKEQPVKKQPARKASAAAATAVAVEEKKQPAKKAAESAEEKKPAAKKQPAKKATAGGKDTASKGKKAPAKAQQKRAGVEKKKATPAKGLKKAVEKAAAEEESDDEKEEEEMTEEQEEALRKEILGDLASSDEGEDSSDEETEQDDSISKNKDVVSLDALEQSKLETKAKFDEHTVVKKDNENTGVIYLGRIPHGFFEEEMNAYFSQFGIVNQVRLSRNRKTGASKHYGFIEFESDQVAKIVADTMHNYLLSGKLLQCKYIPKEHVHPNMFFGAGKDHNRGRLMSNKKARINKFNKKRTPEGLKKRLENLVQRENKRRETIAAAGIKYEFPGYAAEYAKLEAAESAPKEPLN